MKRENGFSEVDEVQLIERMVKNVSLLIGLLQLGNWKNKRRMNLRKP